VPDADGVDADAVDGGELRDAKTSDAEAGDAALVHDDATVNPSQRVYFISPNDGAHVAEDTVYQVGADELTLVAAVHPVAPDEGHLHVFIDQPCVSPGEVIARGVSVRDLDEGETMARIHLEAGVHTLCLQAGNSAHVALALTDEITVTAH
jgi:hypothetical protein